MGSKDTPGSDVKYGLLLVVIVLFISSVTGTLFYGAAIMGGLMIIYGILRMMGSSDIGIFMLVIGIGGLLIWLLIWLFKTFPALMLSIVAIPILYYFLSKQFISLEYTKFLFSYKIKGSKYPVNQKINMFMKIGNKYVKDSKYDKAQKIFRKGVKSEPENKTLLILLGDAYKAQDKMDLAIICFDKVLEIDPTYIVAIERRGVALDRKTVLEGSNCQSCLAFIHAGAIHCAECGFKQINQFIKNR